MFIAVAVAKLATYGKAKKLKIELDRVLCASACIAVQNFTFRSIESILPNIAPEGAWLLTNPS